MNNIMSIDNGTMRINNMKFVFDDGENKGWVCPKCGRAISPQYKTCPYCSTQYADEGLKPGEQMICDAQ